MSDCSVSKLIKEIDINSIFPNSGIAAHKYDIIIYIFASQLRLDSHNYSFSFISKIPQPCLCFNKSKRKEQNHPLSWGWFGTEPDSQK